jgi:hypothetical protein
MLRLVVKKDWNTRKERRSPTMGCGSGISRKANTYGKIVGVEALL